jgi:hypothetical protein
LSAFNSLLFFHPVPFIKEKVFAVRGGPLLWHAPLPLVLQCQDLVADDATKHSNGNVASHAIVSYAPSLVVRLVVFGVVSSYPPTSARNCWLCQYSDQTGDPHFYDGLLRSLPFPIFHIMGLFSLNSRRMSGTLVFCPCKTMEMRQDSNFSCRRCSFEIGQSITTQYSRFT